MRPAAIFLFFNDTATTEIYTLSLHDALPIFEFKKAQIVPAWHVPKLGAGKSVIAVLSQVL